MRKAFFALSLLFFFVAAARTSDFDWKDLHEKADRSGLPEALEDLKKNPEGLQDLYVLGLVYLNRYDISAAQQTFEKMLSLDSQNVPARWGLADVLRRRHEPEKAEKLLDEIIKDDPAFYPAYITLGYMLFDTKEYDRSIRLALKVLKGGRDHVDLTNYTRAYLIIGGAKGMIADAGGPLSKLINGTQILPYLKKAEALMPDYVGVLFGLGSFYTMAPSVAGGDWEKGLGYLEKTIKADPQFVDVYARLAQVWGRRGDKEKSKAYLAKALKLDPQNELALRVKNEEGAKN